MRSLGEVVVKPVQADVLLEKIQKVVTNVRAIISSEFEILKWYDIDKKTYLNLVNSFRDLLLKQSALLEHQTESSETGAVVPDLHQLQESATVFRAERLCRILNQLLTYKEETPDYTGLLT